MCFNLLYCNFVGNMQDAIIDQVRLNFSPEGLFVLNIILGFIMFGIALELKFDHFSALFSNPRSTLAGIFSQFILLPLVTFLLIFFLNPLSSIALGMILVAACPGGNISNFFSSLSKSNTALSISLTAIATSLATFMTPFNYGFWSEMYIGLGKNTTSISLDPAQMFFNIFVLLGIPVIIGMLFSHFFPRLTEKITGPIKMISMAIFILFVIIAFTNNYGIFLDYIHLVITLVFLHNIIALMTGYYSAKLFGLSKLDQRTIAIETGIQNSGLGLILIFNFFGGNGGMAIVAAWWGIWHIISGFAITLIWEKNPVRIKV